MRYLQLIAVCLVLGLGAAGARSQAFEFYAYNGDDSDSLSDIDFGDWSNMARCLCDEYAETGDASTATLNIHIKETSGSLTTQEVYIYLGDDCDSESTTISDVCWELAVINHSDFNVEQSIQVPIHRVVDPMDGQCSEINGGSTTLYVIMDDPNAAPSATYTITYDTSPPGVPSAVTAQGGEGAVSVSWEPPSSDDEDIEYYDVLCTQADAPIGGASSTAGSWTTTLEVCGQALPDDASGMSTDCSGLTGGLTVGDPYPNPCFVCGTVGTTATDLRISGLENNVAYQFAVVAIDDQGNVSAISDVVDATPVPTTDFAEHYSASGGAEEGGFCYIATAVYGDYDHPNVRQLRTYRDRVLSRSSGGQRFVDWYYAHGPKLVRLQQLFPQLRLASRLGLEGLTWVSAQLTTGKGGDPQRAALPLGMLLLGALLSLRHLAGRREEDPAPEPDDPKDPEVML